MITPGSGRHCARPWCKRPINAVTCIFLRNALDYAPRRVDDDCLQELRWLYDRRDLSEARRDLAAWLTKWSGKYPKLTGWVEENIDETLTFYRLPRQHYKHLEIDQYVRTLKRRNQTPHPCRADLPQRRELFAPGASPRRRDFTRTGSNSIATSISMMCPNTKRKRCGARHDRHRRDPPELGAVLAAVHTAARRLRRWPAASLDRGCARRQPWSSVGTTKRPLRSNKETTPAARPICRTLRTQLVRRPLSPADVGQVGLNCLDDRSVLAFASTEQNAIYLLGNRGSARCPSVLGKRAAL
jgi:Transposase, Mutator family